MKAREANIPSNSKARLTEAGTGSFNSTKPGATRRRPKSGRPS